MRTATAVAIVVASLVVAGCAASESQPEWAPRADSSAGVPDMQLDYLAYADLGEAADHAQAIFVGRFDKRVAKTNAAELFPTDGMTVANPELAQARRFDVWSFVIDEVIAGDARPGREVLVAVESFGDPELGLDDPSRTKSQRAVLLADGIYRESSLGPVLLPVSPQPGYSFALVAQDGKLILDPESAAELPRDARLPSPKAPKVGEELAEAVSEQLALP